MAVGKTVTVLAVAAAVCVVYFAQEAAGAGAINGGECNFRPNCTEILKDCPNPCCHGSGIATAGYPPNPEINDEKLVNAFAVNEGKCVCCRSPESCILIAGKAQNTETQASAYDEVCKVYSGPSSTP